MRIAATFGLVAVVSASAGAAAQHLTSFLAPVSPVPRAVQPLIPTVVQQSADATQDPVVRHVTRGPIPVEENPYGPVPGLSGRLAEIAGHESGLADAPGNTSYRRVAGARPHIASNPYFYSSSDDGLEHKADPGLARMDISQNPYAF